MRRQYVRLRILRFCYFVSLENIARFLIKATTNGGKELPRLRDLAFPLASHLLEAVSYRPAQGSEVSFLPGTPFSAACKGIKSGYLDISGAVRDFSGLKV